MTLIRDFSATLADRLAASDSLWHLLSRTLVRWCHYFTDARRKEEMRRIVARTPELARIVSDSLVIEGPLQGLKYGNTKSCCSAHYPKLLGSYERELEAIISKCMEKGYKTLIDVGAADGFYAVGMALKMPQARVIAYEQESKARDELMHLATINGVRDRIEIRERCDLADMLSFSKEEGLLIMDCEGYEEVLLSEEVIRHLVAWDFLIETHDGFSRGVTKRLLTRFAATHRVEVVETIHDLDKADYFCPPALRKLPRIEQDLLLSEQREFATLRWLFCQPKTS